MPLLAIGINHRTAPVAIREQVAFDPERMPESLRNLTSSAGVHEAVILSTCNRTEIYCTVDADYQGGVIRWLGDHHALDHQQLLKHMYSHPDDAAVRHLLRVASGLDSMVLGEPQILGQVKTAYQDAVRAGAIGNLLDRLFQHSFTVAKQVRTDTQIGASPVSVAFAAVSLARQIFGETSNRTVLLIGAGETNELVARHLTQLGIEHLVVANRTLERAHQLAGRLQGLAITLEEIPAHLAMADIVVASTASPHPLLGRDTVSQALRRRKRRPMLIVDLAVPRDVDPAVADLEDVYLYSIDDLQQIISENMRSRQDAAAQAEEIIDTQVDRFGNWVRSLDAVRAIRDLRSFAEQIRDEALSQAERRLAAGHDPAQVIGQLATQLTNRLIHGPCQGLREAASDGRHEIIEMVNDLYQPRERTRR